MQKSLRTFFVSLEEIFITLYNDYCKVQLVKLHLNQFVNSWPA